jgi:hypothetical protein
VARPCAINMAMRHSAGMWLLVLALFCMAEHGALQAGGGTLPRREPRHVGAALGPARGREEQRWAVRSLLHQQEEDVVMQIRAA